MFCGKCGTKNDEAAINCTACSEPLKVHTASGGFQADKAKEQVKETMDAALTTAKALGLDPVGGLLKAYQALGATRSLGVGLAFGLVFSLLVVLTVYKIPFEEILGFDLIGKFGVTGFLKVMVIGFTQFLSLSIACLIGEKIGRGKGNFSSNCFISGVALLPIGIVSLISTLIGYGNVEVTFILVMISICMTVMVLFAGLTRIGELSDKAASYIVPLILIVSVWITKVFLTAMFLK